MDLYCSQFNKNLFERMNMAKSSTQIQYTIKENKKTVFPPQFHFKKKKNFPCLSFRLSAHLPKHGHSPGPGTPRRDEKRRGPSPGKA